MPEDVGLDARGQLLDPELMQWNLSLSGAFRENGGTKHARRKRTLKCFGVYRHT